MNERAKQIEEALLSVGMARHMARSLAGYCETAEQREKQNVAAYHQALAIKWRVQQGGPELTFEEAVEVYGKVQVLCEFGARKGRVEGMERDIRDGIIMLFLRQLRDCGLTVASHKDRDGKDLADEQRKPCLAWAMAKATGIGEATIWQAWTKHEFPTAEWG